MNFGTKILSNKFTEFNFWAPDCKSVILCIKNPDKFYQEILMNSKEEGWFSLITNQAEVGAEYSFRLDNGMKIPDPASRYQSKDVHGSSVLINPNNFNWENDREFKGLPWNETVIYEIHTGTFSQEGTFNAIKENLDYLISLGITAIELMPVSAFPGKRNWGYDGVLMFAPDNTYGSPDELKELVKAAHQKGLQVFLDVVYNHFGPEGNYLYVSAKSKFFNSKEKTPWGDSINYKNRYVRDFFIQNALYWLEEYHFDGLRFDAVHAIKDNSDVNILKKIAQAVKEKFPDRHIHLMLENDNNEAKYLCKEGADSKISLLDKTLEAKTSSFSANDCFTAQWNDDFHHAMHVVLTGEKYGYYQDYTPEKTPHNPVYHLAKALAQGFSYQGESSVYRGGVSRGENTKNLQPTSFINFLQNHDMIGNRPLAERINKLTSPEALKAAVTIQLLSPAVPLLFMGEEFGCEEPFYFFCDFEEKLSESVKKGRSEELSSGNLLTKIPCVTTEKAFTDSKINRSVIADKKHKEILDFYKKMLKIRKTYIVPLLPKLMHSQTNFEIIGDSAFLVEWEGKNGETLELLANLGEKDFYYDEKFFGEPIAESVQDSFIKFKQEKVIQNRGVFWFLNGNTRKTIY